MKQRQVAENDIWIGHTLDRYIQGPMSSKAHRFSEHSIRGVRRNSKMVWETYNVMRYISWFNQQEHYLTKDRMMSEKPSRRRRMPTGE